MYKKNFDSIHYWDALKEKTDLFEGAINNYPLTRNSIFVNSVIFNKGEILDTWAYYPSVKALIGFLKYVFLPSCYLNYFIDDEDNTIIVDVETIETVTEILDTIDNIKNKDKVELIESDFEELDKLWDLDDEDCLLNLRIFIKNFNKRWSNTSNDTFFYLNVFATPMEIGEYLINTYQEVGMDDLFDKDIEYSKDEFLNIVNNVYGNKFLEKKFVELLNNKIPMLV